MMSDFSSILPKLSKLKQQLKDAGIYDAANEIRYILKYLGKDNTSSFSIDEQKRFDEIVNRRAKREPLAKIIGQKSFWNSTFITTCDTLDPRCDSETMIEAVIKTVSKKNLNILDLGTGTGCLLLSLLQEFEDAVGVGCDISEKALSVAFQNAKSLSLNHRAKFVISDWLSAIDISSKKFDVVVSNPPYIPNDDSRVNAEASYDPAIALYAGQDGLCAYRAIFKDIHKVLDGDLFVEIGIDQEKQIIDIAQIYGLRFCQHFFDLNGVVRILQFTR